MKRFGSRGSVLPALLALAASASAGSAASAASTGPGAPVLSIPTAIPGDFGIPVSVPVVFTGQGAAISTALFSVDYDQDCLDFDDTDADVDGTPDAITFQLPPAFIGTVTFDAGDSDGELDFAIIDFLPPLAALPDGTLVTVSFTPSCEPMGASVLATVGFSDDPAASFGDTGGQSVAGSTVDGSVEIAGPIFADGFESGDTSAW